MRDARTRIIERRLHLASEPLVVGGGLVRSLQGCGPIRPRSPRVFRVVTQDVYIKACDADPLEISRHGFQFRKEPYLATLGGKRPYRSTALDDDPPTASLPNHVRSAHGARFDQFRQCAMVYRCFSHDPSNLGDVNVTGDSLITLLLSDKLPPECFVGRVKRPHFKTRLMLDQLLAALANSKPNFIHGTNTVARACRVTIASQHCPFCSIVGWRA